MNGIASDPASHPLSIGAKVAVFRPAPSTMLYLEGRAVIEGVTNIPNLYRVRFVDEPLIRLRRVYPDMQHEPEGLALALADLYRHDALEDPFHDEFFPDERFF